MSSLNELYAAALPQETKDVIKRLARENQEANQIIEERNSEIVVLYRFLENAKEYISRLEELAANRGLEPGIDYEPYKPD